ncbi:hypothetical protein AT239_02775 [Bartonella henselae]|nr:hypothetical protein AT239_02775 [Bartonella henselae]OLL55800.1 hypothetical protein AT240_00465 [Bartonella henselae]
MLGPVLKLRFLVTKAFAAPDTVAVRKRETNTKEITNFFIFFKRISFEISLPFLFTIRLLLLGYDKIEKKTIISSLGFC